MAHATTNSPSSKIGLQQRQILLDFLEQLDQHQDIDPMFSALDIATQRLGFDGIAYTYIPTVISQSLGSLSPVFKMSDSYSPQFISHYSEASFAEQDFTIKRISEGCPDPINWWQEARRETLSLPEKHVIEVARHDYQIHHGITIPTHQKEDGIAGVSVISQNSDQQFSSLCDDSLSNLNFICQLFNTRVMMSFECQTRFYLPFLQSLSDTQKQVLKHLALGMNLKRIAHLLGINYKYANEVVKQLRIKFGNVSRERLLYLAGLMRFNELVR